MKGKEKMSKSAATGAVALIFLVLGFQAALFAGSVFKKGGEKVREESAAVGEESRAAAPAAAPAPLEKGTAANPSSQTAEPQGGKERPSKQTERGKYGYSDSRAAIARKVEERSRPKPESFRFNPNTVSLEELQRLGFSQRQAEVILRYREKGGVFNRPSDFARMYVVDSALYGRLEPFIDIPKLDLNAADSASLLGLRGIGPYYAGKIVEYRRRLGGSFAALEQLLEIEGFTAERLEGFSESVTVGPPRGNFSIWNCTEEQLKRHPYIGPYAAKGILRYKNSCDSSQWTIDALVENGVIRREYIDRLR